MKKTYHFMIALMAVLAFGAMNVNAGERIPFTSENFTFYSYDGFGADAVETGELATAAWLFDEASGCPIGDTACNAWCDLGDYEKMIVNMEGCDANGEPNGSNPRIFINRLETEGQFNSDRSVAKCLVIPNAGTWAEDYYTDLGDGEYEINLYKIKKDFGFVHFHSIKGSAWNTQAIVHSLEVEKPNKVKQVGWVNLVVNSNMEGEDNSSFFYKEGGDVAFPVTFVDGAGRDGSRGIQVTSLAGQANDYGTQFFIYSPEVLTEGTKYRVTMDIRSSMAASASTQSQAQPTQYIFYDLMGSVPFTEDWETFKYEGEVSAQQAATDEGLQFQSIAFNLATNKDNNVDFFFDNVKWEVYKYGTDAVFKDDAIKIDFGFDTNIPALVKATGKPVLVYPTGCASAKVNGKEVELYSVEAHADGSFYVFLEEPASSDDEVLVSFKNPTDPAYQILFVNNAEGPVKDIVDLEATYEDVLPEDAYPYDFMTPTLLAANPEDGAFNLPNDLKEVKLTFDKGVDIAKMKAEFDGVAMTVNGEGNFPTEITLTRADAADLKNGPHTVYITKVYPEMMLAEEVFLDSLWTINIGKVTADPTNVPYEVVPKSYFTDCVSGGIPQGYILYADGETPEERIAPNTYGSGARMMEFAAGGDFTKGLYMRTWYVEYGKLDADHKVTLEKDKKYEISFNTCRWAAAGQYTKFVILTAGGDEVYSEVVTNNPNVNEKRDAVNGSTFTKVNFIPEEDGDYILQWIVASNAQGTPTENAWQNGVILANVMVKYMPNIIGLEYAMELNDALEKAKAVAETYANERYAGIDYSALQAAIAKYESEMDGYTNPSQYTSAVEALGLVSDAVKAHGQLCDEYDKQIKGGIDVVRQCSNPLDNNGKPNTNYKFSKLPLFGELTAVVDKYNGTSEWRNVADTIADPTAEQWQLFYSYDLLTQNDSLSTAIQELKDIVAATSNHFTSGVSATGDCGTKVLVDRIRRGYETLAKLGVPQDDDLYLEAFNAVTDDDELAEAIKERIKTIVYEDLSKAEPVLFATIVDPETLAETTPSYDMSVFFKNPNSYAFKVASGFNAENVPGWEATIGGGGITTMWVGGTPRNIDGLAEDVALTTYHSATRFEQTAYDLPAGVYTVTLDAASWANEDVTNAFVFAKTSDTPVVEDGFEEDVDVNFAAHTDVAYYGEYQGHHDQVMEGIVVVDGQLTLGANFPETSQWMFDQIKSVNMTGAASGVDYASLYQEALQGIDEQAAEPVVRHIAIYDLNGRQIKSAQNAGIVIVKKFMSDGTVRTEKFVKK